MIKARVSKNLKGGMMLPTVSRQALTANADVYFTEDQQYAADIQVAIAKKLLIIVSGASGKEAKLTKVTNLSFGSVSLPGVGVLRAGKSMEIRADLASTPPFRVLEKDGLVAYDLKFNVGNPQEDEVEAINLKKPSSKKLRDMAEDDAVIRVNMQKGRPITVDVGIDENGRSVSKTSRGYSAKQAVKKSSKDEGKKAQGIKRIAEDSLLIDPNADDTEDVGDFLLDPRTGKPIEDTQDVIFVDHEQTAARMNPRLKEIKNRGK